MTSTSRNFFFWYDRVMFDRNFGYDGNYNLESCLELKWFTWNFMILIKCYMGVACIYRFLNVWQDFISSWVAKTFSCAWDTFTSYRKYNPVVCVHWEYCTILYVYACVCVCKISMENYYVNTFISFPDFRQLRRNMLILMMIIYQMVDQTQILMMMMIQIKLKYLVSLKKKKKKH